MFHKDVYVARRAELRGRVSSGGLILLPANGESPANYPNNCYHFRQDSTFLYFFGLHNPGLAGLMDVDAGTEALYGDDLTMDDIIWTGPQPTMNDLAASVGVRDVHPLSKLAEHVSDAVRRGRRVHFLPPYRPANALLVSSLTGIKNSRIAEHISVELALAVVSLRDTKSDEEIDEIERACAIGYKMHTAAMSMCKPGVVERRIAGTIEGIALSEGGGVSFTSIVSQNGETLHNHYYGNTLQEGRLLLVDAGAETTMNYCSDFTRTMPVGGRFTQQQKEIYNIVLAANARGFELSRPGALYRDVHLAAARVITEGLAALGLMKGDVEESLAAGAFSLFMPHGLGHMMGLDVHDMEDIGENYVGYDLETERSKQLGVSSLRMGRRLKPGFVMTVEPGIYFIPALIDKWRREGTCREFINFSALEAYLGFGGIRIEDDILITPGGNRMLGEKRVPATVEQIEEFMRG